jgi:hypothetical protein
LWQAAAAAAGLAVHPAGATTSLRQFPVGRDAVARPELLGGCNTHAAFADRGLGHAAPAAAFCDLLIIGSAVFGADDPGADVRAACLGMAEARQTPVLAVTLARQAGDPRWRFVDADAAPTITEGAPLAALADLMVARAG